MLESVLSHTKTEVVAPVESEGDGVSVLYPRRMMDNGGLIPLWHYLEKRGVFEYVDSSRLTEGTVDERALFEIHSLLSALLSAGTLFRDGDQRSVYPYTPEVFTLPFEESYNLDTLCKYHLIVRRALGNVLRGMEFDHVRMEEMGISPNGATPIVLPTGFGRFDAVQTENGLYLVDISLKAGGMDLIFPGLALVGEYLATEGMNGCLATKISKRYWDTVASQISSCMRGAHLVIIGGPRQHGIDVQELGARGINCARLSYTPEGFRIYTSQEQEVRAIDVPYEDVAFRDGEIVIGEEVRVSVSDLMLWNGSHPEAQSLVDSFMLAAQEGAVNLLNDMDSLRAIEAKLLGLVRRDHKLRELLVDEISRVAQRLGIDTRSDIILESVLNTYPDSVVVKVVGGKGGKRRLYGVGLTAPNQQLAEFLRDHQYDYDLLLKPVDGWGSKGITILEVDGGDIQVPPSVSPGIYELSALLSSVRRTVTDPRFKTLEDRKPRVEVYVAPSNEGESIWLAGVSMTTIRQAGNSIIHGRLDASATPVQIFYGES